eukprot:4839057-Pyramimonas_sp.AAC.1
MGDHRHRAHTAAQQTRQESAENPKPAHEGVKLGKHTKKVGLGSANDDTAQTAPNFLPILRIVFARAIHYFVATLVFLNPADY